MKLGIVTDEISLKVEESLGYCNEWGIDRVEIRCLESGRVPYISEEELKKFIELKNKFGIKVTALSPGFFKGKISDTRKYKDELDKHLPNLIKMCETFETNLIIVFGFEKDKDEPLSNRNNVVDVFGEIAKRTENYGIKIAVENEPGFWCDTGSRTAEIIRKVNMKNFGSNWDPANAYYEHEESAYPDGYEKIKDLIFNVHVKDTKVGSLIKCCPIGEGKIDWNGQIKALLNDKIVEHVTIETHCTPLVEKSKLDVDRITEIIKKYS
jgi:sugar phosphate isomerase/epimerase